MLQGMRALVKDKYRIALEIGANIGNHSIFLSALMLLPPLSQCPITAYYSKPICFFNQTQNITLIEKTLSNSSTKMGIDKGSSRNTNNAISELSKKDEDAISQILVDVAVDDEVIKALNLKRRINLIKIDVEGRDSFMVEGLRKKLVLNSR